MIDIDATAVSLALADAALVTAVSGHIYAGSAPPVGYDPKASGCVVLKSRGAPSRYDPMIEVSIQVKCYGPNAPAAWEVYKLTDAALNERSGSGVVFSLGESIGQALTEPATGRDFVLAYYRMFMRP